MATPSRFWIQSADSTRLGLTESTHQKRRNPSVNAQNNRSAILVFGQSVAVEAQKTDRYGRKVGKLLFQGGDINLEQVSRGMAWHYKDYAHEQSSEDRLKYATAEESARSANKGLWRDAAPTPP